MTDEQRVIANYIAIPDAWTDMPEAEPRARCRVAEGEPSQPVTILDDRTIVCDDSVEIDTYQGEEHAKVRAERLHHG